jgi:predicted permease
MKFLWGRRAQRDLELEDELSSHLTISIRARIERGETPEQARANALREFGNVGLIKETTREMWGWASLERLREDLRYGLRMMRKNPGFSLVAIITLALGIGANTAIFSVVNAVLLRSLPYHNADRMVNVAGQLRNSGYSPFSLSETRDLQTQAQTFDAIAGEHMRSVNLTGGERPDRVRGGYVTSNYFDVFHIGPLMGRTFAAQDELAGASRVVVVREDFWRTRMNASSDLASKTLTLDGELYQVIGVVPASFRSVQDPDSEVWMTAQYFPGFSDARDSRYLFLTAHLKPGVSLTQAQTDLKTIAERWALAYPKENGGRSIAIEYWYELAARGLRRSLVILSLAVGFVLLIACANLANLMLLRGAARAKELMVRAALGASRWRLLRQILTESMLICLFGGGLGVLLAWWSIKPLLELSPGLIPYNEAELDWRVLSVTLALTLLTGLLAGLAPALQFGNPDLQSALKEGGRTSNEGLGWRRARGVFVTVQVALSFTLLIGAGLLVKSFYKLLHVDPGFKPDNVLTFEYRLPRSKYRDDAALWNFHRQVTERIKEVPGMESVALARGVSFTGNGGGAFITLPDRESPERGKEPGVLFNTVTANYFATMRIPLMRGRPFNEADDFKSPPVYLINQTMAVKFWPNEDPVGKQVYLEDNRTPGTVIGVVGDTKHLWLSDTLQPQMYAAYSQMPGTFATVAARTNVDPMSLSKAVREAFWKVDADQPLWKMRTMDFLLLRSVGDQRFMLVLMSAFAVLALTLASIGLYGVMAYGVTQRTREIGLRMALGARTADVSRMILGQGMTLTLSGLALGALLAFWGTRLMRQLLFEVSATDLTMFGLTAAVLIAIAGAVCWIPARRASRVDPMITLRAD